MKVNEGINLTTLMTLTCTGLPWRFNTGWHWSFTGQSWPLQDDLDLYRVTLTRPLQDDHGLHSLPQIAIKKMKTTCSVQKRRKRKKKKKKKTKNPNNIHIWKQSTHLALKDFTSGQLYLPSYDAEYLKLCAFPKFTVIHIQCIIKSLWSLCSREIS